MFIVIRVVLIFLLVAFLAGGIAMLGNQLGRKIGRRKMTIFGMRPRHTSIFLTTITGSLIACLTLGLAMVFSNDVREAVYNQQIRLQQMQDLLAKLHKRETDLRTEIENLAEEVRRGTIIWNYEERIALNTIPAGADERAVSNIIRVTLKQANDLSIIKNNTIAYRQNETPYDINKALVEYSEDDFRQWIEQYTNLEKPVGLWVVVTQNCLFQDKVPVKVESIPVELVYHEGDTVYSAELLPSEILLDWHVFLQELKKAALRKGMIEMNDSLGGVIEGDTLKQISRTIDQHDNKIKISAVANRDLYQSSNLDVSIKVKPVVE